MMEWLFSSEKDRSDSLLLNPGLFGAKYLEKMDFFLFATSLRPSLHLQQFKQYLNIFYMEVENPTKQEQIKADEPSILTLIHDIKQNIMQLDKALANKETRQINRIMRAVRKYRTVIKPHHLEKLFKIFVPSNKEVFNTLPGYQADFNQTFDVPKTVANKLSKIPEVQFYLRTLVVILKFREGRFQDCQNDAKYLIEKIYQLNRRVLDPLNATLYFYFARANDKLGKRLQIRDKLLQGYNRASLKNDEIGQATIMNALLRNYISENHIEPAHNFISKTNFPTGISNNEECKYFFYTGKIYAIRMDYHQALRRLNQAIRKAPDRALGFKVQCQRHAIVVQLLLGDIPSRQIFADESIFKHTYAYYRLIKAVINGNLAVFDETIELFKPRFEEDRLLNMISRLKHIVIRVGLRKISLSYSRISLPDIASKLNVDPRDVELVVSKAIRDKVLVGEIDHDKQLVIIKEEGNQYMTNEPQTALDNRVTYCLDLYQTIQKAITYPDTKREFEKIQSDDIDPNEFLNLFDFDDDDM